MEDIQDFVSKIYKQSSKQRSTESYFTKQLHNIKLFDKSKIFIGLHLYFMCVKFKYQL
jgi:hypothetical protein